MNNADKNENNDKEYSIYAFSADEDNFQEEKSSMSKEKEQLYEAYNLLHTLAQVY